MGSWKMNYVCACAIGAQHKFQIATHTSIQKESSNKIGMLGEVKKLEEVRNR